MEIERFEGGALYKGAIDPRRAQKAARVARAFFRYDPSAFFKPPINKVLGFDSKVVKAWVQYPEGTMKYPSLAQDYEDCEGGWGIKAVTLLKEIANEVDELTHKTSDKRLLQIYPTESMLAAHRDAGTSSKIVGLAGAGVFTIHDADDHTIARKKIVVAQGDVLHYYSDDIHSAANVSPYEVRYTLGLIDAK